MWENCMYEKHVFVVNNNFQALLSLECKINNKCYKTWLLSIFFYVCMKIKLKLIYSSYNKYGKNIFLNKLQYNCIIQLLL